MFITNPVTGNSLKVSLINNAAVLKVSDPAMNYLLQDDPPVPLLVTVQEFPSLVCGFPL